MAEIVLRNLRAGAAPLRSPWGLILAIFALLLMLDPARVPELALFALRALAGTAPYILAAVLLIAWLRASGAETIIAKVFEGREWRMIVLAALFGGLAPFCSCEVIPFIAGLLALGVPLAPVMAFWLSSPLIDPPTLLITASALGWTFAVGKAVGAVMLGLMGGFATSAVMRRGFFPDPLRPKSAGGCGCGPTSFQGRPLWKFWRQPARRQVFATQATENALFLIKWLSLAYALEALLVTYVPAELVGGLVGGDGILPIVISALVGAPAYLNSYVAPPMVAGLMEQGMSPGAGMAFMMAGAVSCVPAMAAVWSLVRPSVFAAYVALGFIGAVLAGVLFGLVA
ncbi:MAG: permease [Paracoccaceae bacterium]